MVDAGKKSGRESSDQEVRSDAQVAASNLKQEDTAVPEKLLESQVEGKALTPLMSLQIFVIAVILFYTNFCSSCPFLFYTKKKKKIIGV